MGLKIGCTVLDKSIDTEAVLLLRAAGLKPLILTSFQDIHDVALAGTCDCIVVNTAVFHKYKIQPKRHLWQSKSPVIIIGYTHHAKKHLTTQLYALPKEVHLFLGQKNPEDLYEFVNKAFLIGYEAKKNNPEMPNEITEEIEESLKKNTVSKLEDSIPVLKSEQKKLMTPKLWKLLFLLQEQILLGASPMHIEYELWNHTYISRNRAKDIQSYISKLRTILKANTEKPYTIQFLERRYYLVKLKAMV